MRSIPASKLGSTECPLEGQFLYRCPRALFSCHLERPRTEGGSLGALYWGTGITGKGQRFILIRTEGSFSVKGPLPMDTRCRVRVPLEEAQVEEVPWWVV